MGILIAENDFNASSISAVNGKRCTRRLSTWGATANGTARMSKGDG